MGHLIYRFSFIFFWNFFDFFFNTPWPLGYTGNVLHRHMGYQTKAYDMGNILKASRTKNIGHVTPKNEFFRISDVKKFEKIHFEG